MLLIPLFISPSSRDWFMEVMLWATAVYILLSLKYMYKQSWVKTIIKSFLVMFYIVFVTVIFIGLIMVVNVALYK
jgi:ABC-type multidrug transport system permease subunit